MEKVVLITGVSKGLGKALSEKFRSENFLVAGVSRSKPDFNIDLFIQADLTQEDNCKNIIKETVEKFGRIDVLINNAGVGLYESWETSNMKDIRKLFELNFFAVIYLTKEALPFLKKTKGSIINVSSVAGKLYVPYMGAYCSSKYALNAFSDSFRAELKPYGIHVLNLIVGRINTGFSSRAMGSRKPPETPFGGSPEKFAEKTYRAYIKRKREIWYPYWYKYFVKLAQLFPEIYDRESYKKWK
ncbi:SDR family NAD(P)-dependent oxidoreductase [Persephonella sp.]